VLSPVIYNCRTGAAIEVASGELPGVVQPALLLLTDDVAIGVIDVAIDIAASTVRHPHNRAQPVEEGIILLAIGRALVVQQTTAILNSASGRYHLYKKDFSFLVHCR
jgi:hypothetical protein